MLELMLELELELELSCLSENYFCFLLVLQLIHGNLCLMTTTKAASY